MEDTTGIWLSRKGDQHPERYVCRQPMLCATCWAAERVGPCENWSKTVMCRFTTAVPGVVDWVMNAATCDRPRALVWGLTTWLGDADFTDDIALHPHSQKDVQEKQTKWTAQQEQ